MGVTLVTLILYSALGLLFYLLAAAGELGTAISVLITAGKGKRLHDASQHLWVLCPQPPQLHRQSLVWDARIPALHSIANQGREGRVWRHFRLPGPADG